MSDNSSRFFFGNELTTCIIFLTLRFRNLNMFQYINELMLFERMGKIPRTFIFDIQMSNMWKSLKFNSFLSNITNHYTIHVLVIMLFYFSELRTRKCVTWWNLWFSNMKKILLIQIKGYGIIWRYGYMLLFIIVTSTVCCKICLSETRDRYMFHFDMCVNLLVSELCLTSNLIGQTVPDLDNHQFKFWYEKQHPCIICVSYSFK